MSSSGVPHKAIVGFSIYIHEEMPDGSVDPTAKKHKQMMFSVDGCSEEDCINQLSNLISETRNLWTKKLKKN